MKLVTSLILMVLVFISTMFLVDITLEGLVSGAEDSGTRTILYVILWVISFFPAIYLSLVLAALAGSFTYYLFEFIESKRENKKQIKKWQDHRSSFQKRLDEAMKRKKKDS